MSENALKSRLLAGAAAVGGWCVSPSPFLAEGLAAEGFDYVGIDCQHGLIGQEAMVAMLTALGGSGATPVVRVPANDPATIGQALDAGAEAIVVPLVDTPEQAAAAVAACRYPPDGVRSFGPVRAGFFLNAAPPAAVNTQVLCLVMAETRTALENIDRIVSVPGVDGIYVGPGDLALNLGYQPSYGEVSDEHSAAIECIRHACDGAGLIAAIHAGTGADASARIDQGFRMVSLASDSALLRAAARAQLATAREATTTGGPT